MFELFEGQVQVGLRLDVDPPRFDLLDSMAFTSCPFRGRHVDMAHTGKAQLLITCVASPDKVPEMDRLVASHGSWMAKTHYREGPKALLSYNFSKGPELGNPLDPSSESTGNTRYVLNEIYETPAGIEDHWSQAQASWEDFGAMVEMMASCDPQTLHGGSIAQSLW